MPDYTVTTHQRGGLHTTDTHYEGDDLAEAVEVFTDLTEHVDADVEVRLTAPREA